MNEAINEMVSGEKVPELAAGIERTIIKSFDFDGSRMTTREIKRRFGLCETYVLEMRADKGWSIQRIVDGMPKFLRSKLDGIPWEPDNRSLWLPGDHLPT